MGQVEAIEKAKKPREGKQKKAIPGQPCPSCAAKATEQTVTLTVATTMAAEDDLGESFVQLGHEIVSCTSLCASCKSEAKVDPDDVEIEF